jgi:hypothetical protein
LIQTAEVAMPSESFQQLVSENFFWFMFGAIAVVSIVASTIKSVVGSLARERSRREIAAYIAEKSMTPEEGERLMAAGRGGKSCC